MKSDALTRSMWTPGRSAGIVARIGCHSESTTILLERFTASGLKNESCAIVNEANLTGGENVGGSSVVDGEPVTASSDDDDGDGDSDPDRRRIARRKHAKSTATVANNVLPPDGFVRLPQVLAVIPVSKSTWWAGCKSGRYPQPVKLGPRTTAWRVRDIRSLIEA